MANLIACCYLLFRRGNAFAPDVKPPVRLRRWASAFLATMVLSHVWWFLSVRFQLFGNQLKGEVVSVGLDCVTLMPMMMVTLLTMLQDRRRPLWIVAIMIVPVVVALVVCIVRRHEAIEQLTSVALVAIDVLFVFYMAFFIYMVFAVRQYGKWLRDNYADLEHKEVWQSMAMVAVFMLLLFVYWFDNGNKTIEYLMQVNEIILIGVLLWRVETLQQLDGNSTHDTDMAEMPVEQNVAPSPNPSSIGQLLEQHCEESQLYLQHDLSLSQLSKAIGTNHYYLSQYFARQGMTYNAYINGLRIGHFINLYHEAVAAQRQFTAQQLANESGFRSYSTFSVAFKQRMGQTVTAWMRDMAK